MQPAATYILAGGESRRFGVDKALARLHGMPMVQHVVQALERVSTTSPILVGVRPGYDQLGMTVIPDQQPGWGPAGGVHTALLHMVRQTNAEVAVLVGCDMPWLDSELLGQQIDWLMASPHVAVIAPRLEDRWNPLHAVFSRSSLPAVEGWVASGQRRLQRLLATLDAVDAVDVLEEPIDRWLSSVRNVNRPHQLPPG